MRLVLLPAALICLALPALAQEAETSPATQPVFVNVSYSLNVPFDAADADAVEKDRAYSKAMYARSAGDCADLLATIAATCKLTNISVSTSVNNYPGQPVTISVSLNTTLEVSLK